MHNAHGRVPHTAVCRVEWSCYAGAMKPQSHRNTRTPHDAGRSPRETRSAREGGMHANNRRSPPAVPHRRYPSLSDDGQPWFPRAPWSRGTETESSSAITSREASPSEFSYVRVIAIAAIVAIIATLVASA
jgi:hypothetical protein